VTDEEVIAMLRANIGHRISYLIWGTTVPVTGVLIQCGTLGRDVMMRRDDGGVNVIPFIHNITLI
jgi:hypothetical protein